MSAKSEFVPLSLCVLTVSDSRTMADDTSGDFLCDALTQAGHKLHARTISKDDRYKLRAVISNWIIEPGVNGILVTGGP